MDSDISSEHAQQLLEDRVKFKLYAAEQHLNELKNIKQKHGSIRKSPEILVKAEMEIDCFLAHIMGARDSLLVEINNELGLMMPLEDVKLETVNARLDDIIKRDLLKDLNHLISNNTSWLWFLNEIRNHSLHRERIPGHVRIDMIENVNNNSSQSEQTIHFVENVRTRNNPHRQKDIILFLHESLDLMTKLIESIRGKLIAHQYRNTVRSPIDIPIAQFVKEVNDRFGNNGDILEAIAENASDLAPKIKDKLIDTGADLAETIESSLTFTEPLKPVDEQFPKSTTPLIVDKNKLIIYPEILGWSIAILASAWCEWVFTSKTNPNSKYQTDPAYESDMSRRAARVNVGLALPYIKNSIIDAIDKAREIGNCKETDYAPIPDIDPANIKLRKD